MTSLRHTEALCTDCRDDATRSFVLNRLGRALADPTRSRLLMSWLERSAYSTEPARDLKLPRSNVANRLVCLHDCGIVVTEPEGRRTRYEIADPHLTRALTARAEVGLAVNENAPCVDPACSVPGCCNAEAGA